MPTNDLQRLLREAIIDDYHEEAAIEYLEDRGIYFYSHSRQYLIELAYRNGWRPQA
jgi:DNA phosphorothioation-dependent restriction protein DptG